ncbi:hypothetical protein GCM10018780_24530 [Streptomyces lanatus]|nr:hypothetical protein GCM10018780_24530 [Streptomyces lanatus]
MGGPAVVAAAARGRWVVLGVRRPVHPPDRIRRTDVGSVMVRPGLHHFAPGKAVTVPVPT